MAATTTARLGAATPVRDPYYAYLKPQLRACRRVLQTLQDASIDGCATAVHIRRIAQELAELEHRCKRVHRVNRLLANAAARASQLDARETAAIQLYQRGEQL